MKKMASHTSRHRIRRWGFISTFGTMGGHKNAHQNTEWNLDAGAMALYRHKEGIWTSIGTSTMEASDSNLQGS
jgi:hypothetical protein